jgi:DNA polymerase-3 subunit beta
MKIIIPQSDIARALASTVGVVEKRTTIPIIGHVLIDAVTTGITITATDMEREIMAKCAADVVRAGAVTLPGQLLANIAKKVRGDVTIDADAVKGAATITAGASKFSVQTLPAGDFPRLSSGVLPHRFRIDAATLVRMFDKTKFAQSTEETRYYLNGVYWHVADVGRQRVLRAVATDGHRLARVDGDCPAGAEAMDGIIIPRKTVDELLRLLDRGVPEIDVGVSPSAVRVTIGDVVMTSKLIDGTFPDYMRVIPTGNDKPMTVACAMLAEAIDRIATVADERAAGVQLDVGADCVTIMMRGQSGNAATETVDVTFGSAPVDIGFNAGYVAEILKQIDDDIVVVDLADASTPAIFRDGNDASVLYLLMPMRVK